jgi:hypothetical protein
MHKPLNEHKEDFNKTKEIIKNRDTWNAEDNVRYEREA